MSCSRNYLRDDQEVHEDILLELHCEEIHNYLRSDIVKLITNTHIPNLDN
ncbi:hypothetical protein HanPSC8_Chr01g0027491 [Helianthus annuus]|nr:hypothetical protein HanPSC8_Chr01g0027491 [Helianthus annuus]